jgi:GrpB-like predicted nucleotidyltransferase (UPF0157 family)
VRNRPARPGDFFLEKSMSGPIRSEIIAVELHPHSPVWIEIALTESAALEAELGDLLLKVEHMGSTAIPGIAAKPIIDLMPIARDEGALDAMEPGMLKLGYEWLGEFGIPGRRYCRKGDPLTGKRKIQLHCFAQGATEIARHLAFRDYLCAHPGKAKEYEAEKQRAAALHPDNVLAYNDAKSDWIKRTEREALAWWHR